MNAKLKLAVDVHYVADANAFAAGVAFADWSSDEIARSVAVRIPEVLPYRPGHFYERELPCVLTLLDHFGEPPAILIIDGFITLGAEQRDGLGAHVYRRLGGRVPVIGVAKSPFAGTPDNTEVFRGTSRRPLYVTSRGIGHEEAKQLIREMHGGYRLPTLLNAVDRACREAAGTADQ